MSLTLGDDLKQLKNNTEKRTQMGIIFNHNLNYYFRTQEGNKNWLMLLKKQ
jgi:hypothetical protein